jgi:chromosome segregation ATPase
MAIELNIDGKSIVELRNQLKGLRNDLAAATDPEQVQELAAAAGQVKDKMKDINEQVQIFSSGSKFEQAGIALGQVKDNLMNLDFEGAAEKARSLTTIVRSISFAEATKGLKDLGTTFMSLGKALITNPLFLIPAAIIAILGAMGLLGPIIDGLKAAFSALGNVMSDFLDYLGITNTEADKLANTQKKLTEESNKQKEAIAEEGKAYISLLGQLSATNRGSEERKTLIKDINTQYGTTLSNMSSEAEFQKQVNAEMDNYIKYLIAKYTLQANEDKIKKNIETQMKIQEEYNKSKSEEKRILDEINSAQERIRDAGFDQTGRENAKLAQQDVNRLTYEFEKQKEQTALVNQNLSNARQRFKSYANSAPELSNTITELTNSGVKYSGAQKAVVTTTKEAEDELNPLLDGMKLMYSEMFRLAEKDKQARLKLNADTLQGQLDILEEQKQKELENKDLTELEKLEIEKRYYKQSEDLKTQDAEKQKTLERNLVDAKLQIATDGFNLVSNLTELFNNGSEESAKKAFNVNKAVGIAQATIQTYQAAQAAYLSQMSVPSPDAPIRASIAAGVAVAAGIANIAKIAKTQYKSSTPSGGSPLSNTGNLSSTPSYNLFGSNNNQNSTNASMQQQVNVNNQVMVKAYVSETDVTNTQERVARYKNSAEL